MEGEGQEERAASIPIGVDRQQPEEEQAPPGIPPGVPPGVPQGGAAASEAQAAQPGRAVGETGVTEGIPG